ncbi:MAG TPA: cytochrome c [Gammaproteobacteria bacterium]|nr:cytochrome c [Gammaproteobacteria bacterium]
MMRSIQTAIILCCAGLLLYGPAQAETFDRGQALYENHCQTCHEEQVHMRYSRRAASMEDLRQQVSSWSYHAALGWSAEEVTDVVDYLDREFYHFAEPAEKDTR